MINGGKRTVGIGIKAQCLQIVIPASIGRYQTAVIGTHAQLPELLLDKTVAGLQHHKVIELYVAGILDGSAIDIDLIVAYLERVARHADATLHIVLAPVDGPIDNLPKLLLVVLQRLPPHIMGQRVIVGIGHPHGHRVARREIKDDDVAPFHLAKAGQPVIGPRRPLDIGLDVEYREGVLHERERERRVGHARPVADFAHKEVIAHEQRFFERRGGYLIILEKENIDKIDCHQGIHDGIDPLHDTQHGLVFRPLPKRPRHIMGKIDVGHDDEQRQNIVIVEPHRKKDKKNGRHAETYPAGLLHGLQPLFQRR